jgi:hypothetical protein
MVPAHDLRGSKLALASVALGLLAVTGVSTALAGLRTAPPKDVDLTALWKINPELSDDPQKVIARNRDRENVDQRSRSGSGGSGTGTGDIFGGVVFGGVIVGGSGGASGGTSDRPAEDPSPNLTRVPLDSFLATREQFEIEQRPESLTIRTDEESSTCKPGESQRVPMQGGELVEQRCGWDGDTFVVELISEDGVKRTTRYELKDNAKRLLVVSTVKGGHGHLANLRIKRIYERLVAF